MTRRQAASEDYDDRDHYDWHRDHIVDPPDRYENDEDD